MQTGHYAKHIFICTNQKDGGKKCCQNANAKEVFLHAKHQVLALGLAGEGKVRVSQSGCLGRCAVGPALVIYPEGVWYTYRNMSDIDHIIQQHILKGEVVKELLLDR